MFFLFEQFEKTYQNFTAPSRHLAILTYQQQCQISDQ